jgi:hypothetical protein
MQFRKSISYVMLVALLMWTMSAMCAPLPVAHGPACVKLAYRTMVMEHPQQKTGMTAHKCCAPKKVVVIVCYRMHGDGDCDAMSRCRFMPDDEAISGTAKYHDDGQAHACATAHATKLLIGPPELSGTTWDRAGSERSVLDTKADLRI